MIKFLIAILFLGSNLVCSQDKTTEEIDKEKKEAKQVELYKRLAEEKEEAYNDKNAIDIMIPPNHKVNQKGKAKLSLKNGEYEEFEFDRKSASPSDNGLSKKGIIAEFTNGNIGLSYSGMYTLTEGAFENNLELHFDSIFTWGIRTSFLKDKDNPKFSFFGGINFKSFIVEYGYSELDYSIIRLRSTINFSLIGKGNGKDDSLMKLYFTKYDNGYFQWDTYNNYHYEGFIRNIFIEPIIEMRISHDDGKSEFAIGLSLGVNF